MPAKEYNYETEKIANSWMIFSLSFIVSLLILYYQIKDTFWTGIIAVIISSFLVVFYCFLSSFNR